MVSTNLHAFVLHFNRIHLDALERKRPYAQSDTAIPTKKGMLSAICSVDQTVPCHCKLTHLWYMCNLNL